MSLPSRSSSQSRRLVALASAAVLAGSLAACSTGPSAPETKGDASDGGAPRAGGTQAASEDAARPTVTTNVARGAQGVPVDTTVQVSADGGELSRVTVSSPAGRLPGTLSDDGAAWAAAERLEPGTTYDISSVVTGTDGRDVTESSSFTTAPLTLDEQTFASVAPLDGETVGVGMPVVVSFDVPVTDRAAFEKQMTVTSSPAQPGTWHWMSDYEAHWRPKAYWEPGTTVDVDVDVNGVDAGDGIYGQEDREVGFTVLDSHVYKVNAQTHQMQVFSNGDLLRTIPITTGKAGFTTRSGTKVIMEKFESRRMNSETVGIAAGSAESYDIADVEYAMRLTYSGEFIHAAPWSVSSQGSANVSHGCTGMSTENAAWLFDMTLRGDVVEYVGTDRPMTLDNGYGDWNASYADYRQASALG